MWSDLASDIESKNDNKKQIALDFVEQSICNGIIPVITRHHLSEIFAHSDRSECLNRLYTLKKFKMILTPSTKMGAEFIAGDVTDVKQAEIDAVQNGANSIEDVISYCKNQVCLMSCVSGEEIYNNIGAMLDPYMALCQRESKRAREFVALIEILPTKISEMSIKNVLKLSRQRSISIPQIQLKANEKLLEMRKRADRRIDDIDSLGEFYFNGLMLAHSMCDPRHKDGIIGSYFEKNGITDEDFERESTYRNLLDYIEFKDHIISLRPHAKIDEIRKIDRSLLPSWNVNFGINQFRPIEDEHKGSNLQDRYLAQMSKYFDKTFVDKRTMHIIDSADRSLRDFSNSIGSCSKEPDYYKAMMMVKNE